MRSAHAGAISLPSFWSERLCLLLLLLLYLSAGQSRLQYDAQVTLQLSVCRCVTSAHVPVNVDMNLTESDNDYHKMPVAKF